MPWLRRNRLWILQIAVLGLVAAVAVYFLVLQSIVAAVLLVVAAVVLSQGATSGVIAIHRMQLRKVFLAVREAPGDEGLRREMFERLSRLPLDEISTVLVGAVRGDARLRSMIDQILARGEGGFEYRLSAALSMALDHSAAGS